MKTQTKIVEALEQLLRFFDEHGANSWGARTRNAIHQIQEGNVNTKSILNDFVGAGMGSLIDLYISSDNGHSLKQSEEETNKQLQILIERVLIIHDAIKRT